MDSKCLESPREAALLMGWHESGLDRLGAAAAGKGAWSSTRRGGPSGLDWPTLSRSQKSQQERNYNGQEPSTNREAQPGLQQEWKANNNNKKNPNLRPTQTRPLTGEGDLGVEGT